MNFLQMSISGAILILAVIVVRALSVNKLPKRTFLTLWGIVLLRLLIPFSIPSIFSVYSLVNHSMPVKETVGDVTISDFIPAAQSGQLFMDSSTTQAQMPQGSQVNAHISAWITVWCVGTILCAAFFIISYLRLTFEFKTSLPVSDIFIMHWLEEHQLKRSIAIRQSSRVETPLTYGILHPVILLPQKQDWENKRQLQYILLHEYVHICRYDLITKLVLAFTLSVHWFNPMVWLMYILFNRDIELACDECVIRKFGEDSKSEYALTLISMEEKKGGLTPLCNNFSKNAIEERITAVMKIRKTSFAAIIAAVALVACVTTAFATSAITDNKQSAIVSDPDISDEEYEMQPDIQSNSYDDNAIEPYDTTNVSFVSGMGCSDTNCTDASHHHDCPTDCGDYEHHHNCGLDCTIASHHHAYTESGETHHDESVAVYNVSFVSGMGCSDTNCTDASHHHDCPINCLDYEHHHNCALDCTIASHHHSGTSAVSGTTQSHSGQHHKDDHH